MAGVGEPVALFYEDLMRIYPDAKVLLTRREPHGWHRSMLKAIIEPRGYLEHPPISWLFGAWGFGHAKELMEAVREKVRVRRRLNHTSWTAVEAGEDVAVDFYERWNRHVIDTVPPDRLLGRELGIHSASFFKCHGFRVHFGKSPVKSTF